MNKKEQGFSLLEMLVVIAIIGVLTGVTSDIFIQIIKGQNKGNVVTEIKQNGDIVLNKIERIVRNAEEITSIGEKEYGVAWNINSNWTDISPTTNTISCPSSGGVNTRICAIIVKNPASVGGYTKVEIHPEKDQECGNSPFTEADREQESSPYNCNGNVRIITDLTNSAITNLKTATSIGQVITNTEKRSGVSITQYTPPSSSPLPFFSIRSTSSKPTLVSINYALSQGISASSRSDSQATVPFDLTISLRSY